MGSNVLKETEVSIFRTEEALKMDAADSSETLVCIYQIMCCHI
jgi:hypothetical protein